MVYYNPKSLGITTPYKTTNEGFDHCWNVDAYTTVLPAVENQLQQPGTSLYKTSSSATQQKKKGPALPWCHCWP